MIMAEEIINYAAEDSLIKILEFNCEILIDKLDKSSKSYIVDLINLAENSNTLAVFYLSKNNFEQMIKYEAIGNSALNELNDYIYKIID
jgi:hypothetical protein